VQGLGLAGLAVLPGCTSTLCVVVRGTRRRRSVEALRHGLVVAPPASPSWVPPAGRALAPLLPRARRERLCIGDARAAARADGV